MPSIPTRSPSRAWISSTCPVIGDRTSPNQWEQAGKLSLLSRAVEERDRILSTFQPKHISDETDAAIRERFPIALAPDAVGRQAQGSPAAG